MARQLVLFDHIEAFVEARVRLWGTQLRRELAACGVAWMQGYWPTLVDERDGRLAEASAWTAEAETRTGTSS